MEPVSDGAAEADVAAAVDDAADCDESVFLVLQPDIATATVRMLAATIRVTGNFLLCDTEFIPFFHLLMKPPKKTELFYSRARRHESIIIIVVEALQDEKASMKCTIQQTAVS